MSSIQFFARSPQGNLPVRKHQDKFEIVWPSGPSCYPSARSLLIALHGGRDPGTTFEKYFRVGKWDNTPKNSVLDFFQADITISDNPPVPFQTSPIIPKNKSETQKPLATTLALFGNPIEAVVLDIDPLSNLDLAIVVDGPAWVSNTIDDTSLTVDTVPVVDVTDPTLTVEPQLGVDLVNRAHEVRKLLFAGFGRKILRSGYDPEDVLQEVYKGLLIRNKGQCPFDPRKSSFGHYVHMVCGCVLSNYHRKQSRRRTYEQVGTPSSSDDYRCQDAALTASSLQGSNLTVEDLVVSNRSIQSITDVAVDDVARNVLPLLAEGWSRREIAKRLGVAPTTISKTIYYLRSTTRSLLGLE